MYRQEINYLVYEGLEIISRHKKQFLAVGNKDHGRVFVKPGGFFLCKKFQDIHLM